MRIESIDFKSFIKNDYRKKNIKPIIMKLSTGIYAMLIPKSVLAATADATFMNVLGAAMNIVDWLVVGVFIFAGVSWMFGHRGKALELLIGGAAGYILARHAVDIRNFLKAL